MKRYILTVALFVGVLTQVKAQSATTSFDVDGIKVIFKPTLKNIINARLYFRAGVADYPANKAGLESLAIEAATQCGTKKYPGQNFRDAADKYSIIIGGSAEQDFGYTSVDCMDKYFNQAWDLFTEAIMNPTFSPTDVELLRDRFITRTRGTQSSPDKWLDHLIMQNGFEGTPYATDPDGTEQSLKGITIDEMKAYYSSILNKNRVFLVVVGKINKQELIDKIHATLAAMPAKPYQPVNYQTPAFTDNKVLVEKRDIPLAYVGAIMNAPKFTDADNVPFRLGMGAFGGLLFSQLRTDLHLSYSQGADVETLLMPYAQMYVSTPKPKEAVKAMAFLLKKIKEVTLNNAGMKELKGEFITGNYVKQQSSSALTESLGLAEILGGWEYEEHLPDLIDKVTPAQINAAFNKHLVGLRWSYLGDPGLANDAADAFKQQIN